MNKYKNIFQIDQDVAKQMAELTRGTNSHFRYSVI